VNRLLFLATVLALLIFQSNYSLQQLQGEYLNNNPSLNPVNGYGNGSSISYVVDAENSK